MGQAVRDGEHPGDAKQDYEGEAEERWRRPGRLVPTRLIGWPAAILATLITLALVVGEITDAGQRG